MYVASAGMQDKVFAFQMPDTPQAPRFVVPNLPVQQIVPGVPVNIQAPRVIANPSGTATVGGTLPPAAAVNGINFNANTFLISGSVAVGTPNGTGLIVVTYTNPYGTARLSIPYRIGTTSAPVFAQGATHSLGDIVQGAPFNITLPAASGFPNPTYDVIGTLIAGGVIDTFSRKLSGVATNLGPGRFQWRASNVSPILNRAIITITYNVVARSGNPTEPLWLVYIKRTGKSCTWS